MVDAVPSGILAQAIEEDSDWAEQVDELDALLRPAQEAS